MSFAPLETKKTITDLLSIMEALRAPETGCPWDVKQTYETNAYTGLSSRQIQRILKADDLGEYARPDRRK